MKKIIVILTLYTLLVGCKKNSDKYFTIEVLVIDFDSKAPIEGAKVYADPTAPPFLRDSSTTNTNGRTGFKYKSEDPDRLIWAYKPGFENPLVSYTGHRVNKERIDTSFLAKPSYCNVNIHRVGSFPVTDSVQFYFTKYYVNHVWNHNDLIEISFSNLKRRPANSADTVINLSAIHFPVPNNKIFFSWEIIRNNIPISSHSDSVELIQFGTKNYTLNY